MTREEAIDVLKSYLMFDKSNPQIDKALDMAIEALQTDLVRCKDCRWYDNRYGDVCHNPRYGDGWANYSPPYVDEDYWCKDGERKGGDSE